MSSRQRTRSRNCSRSTDGIVTSVSSPAANNRASRTASRLSVLTRSAGGRSVLPGAHTPARSPPPKPAAPTHSQSGPPHRPSAPGAPPHPATAKARADGRPPAWWSPHPWPAQTHANVDSRACTSKPTQRIPSGMSVPPRRCGPRRSCNLRREHQPRYAGVPTTFDLQPAGPLYRLKHSRFAVVAEAKSDGGRGLRAWLRGPALSRNTASVGGWLRPIEKKTALPLGNARRSRWRASRRRAKLRRRRTSSLRGFLQSAGRARAKAEERGLLSGKP